MPSVLGLDFGTTNTVIALPAEAGVSRIVTMQHAGVAAQALRSVLCFWREGGAVRVEAGSFAIEKFIDYPEDVRFIQ